MASRLTPCPSCSRHVKVGPPSCPFCGGDVPLDVAARPALVGRPLTRAALMFAGAATVTACSSATSMPAYGVFVNPDGGTSEDGQAQSADGGTVHDSGKPDHDSGQAMAAYGVFVNPDGGTPAKDSGVHPDDGGSVAAYGVFVNPDGGK